jgi:SepF-like predicted cell division protein (DUF552 family)
MPVREFDQNQGMAYGVGFDSVAGDVRGDCVLRTEPESPVGVSGQEVVFKLRQITSSTELAKELNISASASLKAQFGKVSAKASYASQQNINQFSIYLVAQVSVTNPTRRLRDVKLTDEAWRLLEVKGVEEFRERCGDEFLSGITTGGEYLAILQITTRSEEEKQNVSVSVRAKGTGGTWKAGADFKLALEQISKEHEVEVTSFQQGGDTATIPDTVEEIIDRAVNFPQQVDGDKAFAYSAFFQDYNSLNLPDGINPIDVEQQKRVIEKLADYYLSYSDLLNSIEYIFKNSDQFVAFDLTALNQKANDVRKTMNSLIESASNCFDDYRSCKLPDALDPPIVDLPVRKSIEVRDAIDAAKVAANNAVAYAEDAKNAAKKVLEILGTITPGSSGKDFADQARQEAENAKNFAKLARREADNAILAKDKTEEADKFAKTAIAAADEAEQAVKIAERNAEETYKVGYQPYWAGPIALVDVDNIEGGTYEALNEQFFKNFAVCPANGTISFVCANLATVPEQPMMMQCIEPSGSDPDNDKNIYPWHFLSNDLWVIPTKTTKTNMNEFHVQISFESSVTGLVGNVQFRKFWSNHPGTWEDVPPEIKTFILGGY